MEKRPITEFVREPSPGDWEVLEEPGGRVVAIVYLTAELGKKLYLVWSYDPMPENQKLLGREQTLYAACALGWQKGRAYHPVVVEFPPGWDHGKPRHG